MCNLLLLSSNFCKSYFFSWRSSLSFLSFNFPSSFPHLVLGCGKTHSELSATASFSSWYLEIFYSFESSLLLFSFERSLASALSIIELESTGENESASSIHNGLEESILFCILVTAGQLPHKSLLKLKKVRTTISPSLFFYLNCFFKPRSCAFKLCRNSFFVHFFLIWILFLFIWIFFQAGYMLQPSNTCLNLIFFFLEILF